MLYLVLAQEVLYYTIFMRLSKKQGNIFAYLLLFTIATLVINLLQPIKLSAYLAFIVISLVGLKFITHSKNNLYDILITIVMIAIKLLIEVLFTFGIYYLVKDVYITIYTVSWIKICFIFLIRKWLNKLNTKIIFLWSNNNFYIRYIASAGLMIYIIVSCIYLIQYWL